ncbi:MAG: hypothetical protein H6Q73_1696 [Firmicutes bacterium]|nr:hypothetical protein [Bacillota bacterium]
MTKTIALSSTTAPLAELLKSRGYQVIGLNETSNSRIPVDAILYNQSPSPEATYCRQSSEISDISLGSSEPLSDELNAIIMLNTNGLSCEQAISALEGRLRHRHWVH